MILRSVSIPRYKVSVREILEDHQKPSPQLHQPSSTVPTSKYPPNHIEKQLSESLDVVPAYSQFSNSQPPKTQRKKIFKTKFDQIAEHSKEKNRDQNSLNKNRPKESSKQQMPNYETVRTNLSHQKIIREPFGGEKTLSQDYQPSLWENQKSSIYKTFQDKRQRSKIESSQFTDSNFYRNVEQTRNDQLKMVIENEGFKVFEPRLGVHNSPPRSLSPGQGSAPALSRQNTSLSSRGPATSRVIYDQLNNKKLPSFGPSQNSQTISLEKAVELEERIFHHDQDINDLRRKIQQMRVKDQESQRNLLNQLAKKEESLCVKQQMLNAQLQKSIASQATVTSNKEYQTFRRDLELQRQRRLEQLAKENQKLYQSILTKDSIARDEINPVGHNFSLSVSQGLSPMPKFQFFKDNNHHSISALQPNRYEESEEEDNTIGQLLSPFSINPDDF